MKGNIIKVAARLVKEGYKPIIVSIDAADKHKAYCAYRGSGDHKWLTEQQYRLMKNLYDAEIRNQTR